MLRRPPISELVLSDEEEDNDNYPKPFPPFPLSEERHSQWRETEEIEKFLETLEDDEYVKMFAYLRKLFKLTEMKE